MTFRVDAEMSENDFEQSHDDLERRLRRYTPLAPPAHLRRRLFDHERSPRRAWPWAAAAAAMLAAAVWLHSSSTALVTDLAGVSRNDVRAAEVAALAELLGVDQDSVAVAEDIVRLETMRMALMAPAAAGAPQDERQ
jgi:hypothetical protein